MAVAVIAAAVIGAAYQTHPAYDIAIGKRVQDDPLVQDFNAAERQPAAAGGRAYRWTRGESSIVFPGIGRNAAAVTLTMAGGANPNPDVTILANNGEIARLHLTPDFADYPLAIPAPYLTTGNLTLTLQATPFHAPGDRRELGVLVSRVRVQPSGGHRPAPRADGARPLGRGHAPDARAARRRAARLGGGGGGVARPRSGSRCSLLATGSSSRSARGRGCVSPPGRSLLGGRAPVRRAADHAAARHRGWHLARRAGCWRRSSVSSPSGSAGCIIRR